MLKLGFIGCGSIASHHAGVIRGNVKDIELTAGADPSRKALKAFGDSHGVVALFTDYRKMLKEADIDAVCVATPTGLHKEHTLAAAAAGKHVFCEKPIAMSLRDADRMIAACAKAKVKLMIGQVRRYDNEWGTFRKLVRSGAIGRPVLWRQTAGGAGPGRWFMDAKMGGGPFMDGCVHNWDFANFVFGKPLEAIGSIMRFRRSSALDTGTVLVRYRSGDEVMVSWSWGLPTNCSAGGTHDVLGPKGVIKFPRTFPESEFPKNFDRAKYDAFLVDTGKRKRLVKFRKNNLFADEWKDFADAVLENRTPKVTGRTGKEALAVALAVLKTGSSRKPVKV